jgi:hypothetical protein
MESDKADSLSLVLDIAEQNAVITAPLLPKENPSADAGGFLIVSAGQKSDHPRTPKPPRRQGVGDEMPSSGWMKWGGPLLFVVQATIAAVLFAIFAPQLLSGTQAQRQVSRTPATRILQERTRAPPRTSFADPHIELGEKRHSETEQLSIASRTETFEAAKDEPQDIVGDRNTRRVTPLHQETASQESSYEIGKSATSVTAGYGPPALESSAEKFAADAPQPVSRSSASVTEQQLLQRAETLLNIRDISGARLILERAVAMGSAKAAHHLAQTYDPAILDDWQVRGITGDPAKSREFQQLARNLGMRASASLPPSR